MFGQQSFIEGSQYRNSSNSRGRNQRNASYWLAPQFASLHIPDPSISPTVAGPFHINHHSGTCLWANLMKAILISEVTEMGQYGMVRT